MKAKEFLSSPCFWTAVLSIACAAVVAYSVKPRECPITEVTISTPAAAPVKAEEAEQPPVAEPAEPAKPAPAGAKKWAAKPRQEGVGQTSQPEDDELARRLKAFEAKVAAHK